MSVQTLLLDFSLESARLGDEAGQKAVFSALETVLKEYVPGLLLVADVRVDGGSLKLLTGRRGSSVTVRLYDRGLITLSIDYYKEESEEPLITFKNTYQAQALQNSMAPPNVPGSIGDRSGVESGSGSSARALESAFKKYITAKKSQTYVPLKRCFFGRYFPSADERLLEYDIDGVVFDEQSPFQRVQIVHSKSMGNMLVLDDLQNISEADLIYTETLMQRGKEDYEGKEIIILGGGDGALLYELLKERPKFVWMLEIDDMVMRACGKHLRSICGDVLEQRKADNYEIIVEDCMITVNKFITEGKKVDYIFGDLTDIPISDSPCGELWEFMINILDSSFKILKPTGKFMTHGNGATCPESLDMYEQELKKLKPPVNFSKTKAFVPSFLEDWIFYQISLKPEDNGKA